MRCLSWEVMECWWEELQVDLIGPKLSNCQRLQKKLRIKVKKFRISGSQAEWLRESQWSLLKSPSTRLLRLVGQHLWKCPGFGGLFLSQNDGASLCWRQWSKSLLLLLGVTAETWRFKVTHSQDGRNNPSYEFVGRVSGVTPFISSIASGSHFQQVNLQD